MGVGRRLLKTLKELNKYIKWDEDFTAYGVTMKTTTIEFPTGVKGHCVVGFNEDGWEHVSVELFVDRLPKWSEMCYVKNLFWNEDEEVVQLHPKKKHYVNLTEALHLWRPVNGDWSIMNKENGKR
jgi:hypothetical protein